MSVSQYLRTLVTGNGSEVILPWFPEANTNSSEMRLVREVRIEPKGSKWINWPLATMLWAGISFVHAVRTCWKRGKETRESKGLPVWKQFMQMLYLAWFKNHSPLDYYDCRMYDPEIRNQAEFYISAYMQGRLFRKLNAGRPTERLDHKLNGYHTLKAAGLPTVDIVEIFHADGRREFSRTDEELSRFIGQDFFVKPVNMWMGINASRWMYDSVNHQYSDGTTTVAADDIWSALTEEARELGKENPEKQARLVQPLLRNHPDLAPLSKYSLNTLRINMVSFPDGRVEIYHTSLRMGYGDAVDDTSAIISSLVDVETGRLSPGSSNKFHPGVALSHHPTTGAQIEGFKVPCWEEVIALANRAQKSFHENPTIGWDIAVTPDGPLIVEANCNPCMAFIQFKRKDPLTKGVYAKAYHAWMETY